MGRMDVFLIFMSIKRNKDSISHIMSRKVQKYTIQYTKMHNFMEFGAILNLTIKRDHDGRK